MEPEKKPLSFAGIALALANDCSSLFVIDSKDDSYVEYAPDNKENRLVQVNSGDNFFQDIRRDREDRVWHEDRDFFLDSFQKEAVMCALENGQPFSLTYRVNYGGVPRYFLLKATRAGESGILISLRDIDDQKRKEIENESAVSTYELIAGALSSRYEVIYHINIDTNEYIQYSASKQYAKLGTTKQGKDFFADAAADIRVYIHPDDVPQLLERLSKDRLLKDLQRNGTVSLSYRQLLNGMHRYMDMLVVQPKNDIHHIVIGVINTDLQVRREQSINEQRQIFGNISMALAQQYEVIYHVNIRTNEYSEYSADEKYARLEAGAKGKDFFKETQINMQREIFPDDLPMMAEAMQKENLLSALSSYGKTFLNYRLIIDGKPQYVSLYAVRANDDPEHIIISIANIDAAKKMELAYQDAMNMANRDPLTGVKNKRAYAQAESEIDKRISRSDQPPFAILVCDLNGLKRTNDTLGHKAGDKFIRDICFIICDVFTHSPVFRIGGDEFTVLLTERDYEHRDELIQQLEKALDKQTRSGLRPLAFGISEFDPSKDIHLQDVFERADKLMYENKKKCKHESLTQIPHYSERYRYPDEVRSALEGLEQPIAVYQFVDGRIVTLVVSEGFCKLLGYADRNTAVYDQDHDMYKYTHPDDKERALKSAFRFAQGKDSDEYDAIFRTKAGVDSDYQVIHAHGKHIFTETGVRLGHVWLMDEGRYVEGDEASGSEMNRELNSILHEESILKATHYDPLTGLPNLAYFFSLCEIGKEKVFREGKIGVLLYIDLNGMTYYNHKYGFAEGDRLLKTYAGLLVKTFGKDNCCHISAGRFAVSTTEDRLKEQLRLFFKEIEQIENYLPVRVGIYSTGIEDVPITSAYDRAKMACDLIRKSDTSSFKYYSSEIRQIVKRRQHIQASIDRAISEKWIQVYYQPIIRAVNGRVCEEEALVRWIDPEEGFLSPVEFIPYLETSGQIYKLDLYVLEQVLEKIRYQQEAGLHIVPQSINLSRSDFDACDIVEEIRKRVDQANISRSLITIEITESIIGSDFEFMKTQVERFRQLGFPVWMDDFGSGYSSLDVLQRIRFDLIKFDMSFIQKLDEGNSAKIILTEMMRLAAALNVDTVCEGVETEGQVQFLKEIGCSKLQGYFFCKPIPFGEILERYNKGSQIGFEDPAASDYFDMVGRINLYDLDMLASQEEGPFRHTFNTLPIGIIEVKGKTARFLRSNPSYREFIRRFFGMNMSDMEQEFVEYNAGFMNNVAKKCCEQGNRTFYNEKMRDGSVVHSFARRIGTNPVTGETAIAVAVLSISDPGEEESYADIARALAADYYIIYVADLDTERYIEYSSPDGKEGSARERHGTEFFESARHDAMLRIYEEDRPSFLEWFTKENIIGELDRHRVITSTYRLIDTGVPMYVNLKITRIQGTNRIIFGLSMIDPQIDRYGRDDQKLKEQS